MRSTWWHAAVLAAFLLPAAAVAQDVTLTARDGAITLNGTLQGFDGEFYRVMTSYGLLTVDGEGVICAGPGCPDLTAPKALIRITGAPDAGMNLLPGVLRAFARTRGLVIRLEPGDGEFAAQITDPVSGQVLSDITFTPAPPDQARAALAVAEADLIVASLPEQGLNAKVMALDALIPIVAPDNNVPRISTPDLARALSGEIGNWQQLGGPDMPLVLHALSPDTTLQEALEARLGRPVAAGVTHPDLASLAAAVARDPWSLAVTGQSATGEARELTLTDSCGFPLLPTSLAVKAEDYPLSVPVYLVTPRRRLPLVTRELLEFLATPEAQVAVAQAGYVDRAATRAALSEDGQRLINAIRGAGPEIALEELQRLAVAMAGAERLSLTFRFEDGSSTMNTSSRENLADLARLLEIGQFRGEQLVLVGFSDGSGDAAANMDLSRDRAEGVAAALAEAAQALPPDQTLPVIEAFGEAMPMACDTTVAGRQVNRRVELWLRPFTGPVPSAQDELVP
ncbi:OmpA family protein [Fertoebacter nigrum]|uniref:OmpA family protein n=1 Tax=Fertoeibacter niger TaxID=2656921 RepID=A0A8X8KPZ5_9RHOB|nr:phosphate ABC transporter substrate-binding/OmpA family protein [Fertoeibacter niger]NUB45411.1 OmpA family protein [Fertoeibacter niger]